MKKVFFIFVALCATTFASAQIVFEASVDGEWGNDGGAVGDFQKIDFAEDTKYHLISGAGCVSILGEYFLSYSYSESSIYDANLTLVKSLNISRGYDTNYILSKGLFTSDGKWTIMCWKRDNSNYKLYNLTIETEEGVELLNVSNVLIDTYRPISSIIKIGENYKLILVRQGDYSNYNYNRLELYSLPGKGNSGQDIETPIAPRSSARKVLKNDQVLVENAEKTYTLQGQEVK